ncbi:MAG: PAS domain S-box protein [Acidobacteriota bacterium]
MRRPGMTYVQAIAATVAAVLLRWLLDPVMGNALPLVTLFGAVAAAVWLGGYRPALIVAIFGYAASLYLFIEPRRTFHFGNPGDVVGLVAYLFTCTLIIAIGEAMRRANARANAQRETLRVTLRSIGDAVITTDMHGRITYLNTVAESLTGWTHHEALGQPLDSVFRIVNETTRKPVDNPAATALRKGVVVGLANHTVLIRKDGGERAIDDSAAPIKDERGSVSGCVLIFRDVSAQRRLEQEKTTQLMTARLLASIIESSDDAIISKSLDGTIQSWNAAAERLFGHTAGHAIGRNISLVIPADRLAEEHRIIASLKAGQRIDHFETERVRADGQRIQVSLTISPINDDEGRVIGASKIVRDITDRTRVEADRQKFVTLVELSTDFIGMCDLNGIPFFVNRAGLALVGLDNLDEARRTPVDFFFFPEDRQRIMKEFFPSVTEKGHGEIEVRFRHFKTGEARWMAYKVIALPDAAGRPVAFATVSQDVTDRKRLEDDLRRLALDLSDADRRKNEFLAILAHELRNPLAPISNAARALRLSGSDPAAVRSASEMLERQVGQMARLVEDLLDVSRITTGKIELRRERVELGPIVNQAAEAARAVSRSLNHELVVSLPPEPLFLNADPTRLAQVIGNLLNNAAKFTNKGGHINLSVERADDHAVIRVKDDGIGIGKADLPRIFDMFAQVDTSLERSRDGLGIGLTLVRTLVDMHGGTIEAHSDGPGRGSEFVIRLPIHVASADARFPPPVSASSPSTARRVLIVDDNEDGAESLALLLELHGHETFKVHDGVEAVAAAERLRPDAVLLDIGLPGMNGYEACRRIREQPWGKDIFLVALTGWGMEEDRARAREAGFDTHMVKPVNHDALVKLLASQPLVLDPD